MGVTYRCQATFCLVTPDTSSSLEEYPWSPGQVGKSPSPRPGADQRGRRQMKKQYNTTATDHQFPEGTKVWLWSPICRRGQSPKLQSHRSSPFVMINKINYVTVWIQKCMNSRAKVVHYDQLASYHRTWVGPETIWDTRATALWLLPSCKWWCPLSYFFLCDGHGYCIFIVAFF